MGNDASHQVKISMVQQVKTWLAEDLKLPEYFHIFIENGYDDMNVIIKTMDEAELKAIGITKRGHIKKIMLYIHEKNECKYTTEIEQKDNIEGCNIHDTANNVINETFDYNEEKDTSPMFTLKPHNTIKITREMWRKGEFDKFKLKNINTISALRDDEKKDAEKFHIRDSINYMTLASCAVSELLAQSSLSSPQYWKKLQKESLRGISLYEFSIHQDKYFHYMAKVVLPYEAKYIFNTVRNPLFRFDYDIICQEWELIDKLDNDTHIAKYLHQKTQFYVKTERELLAVIKNKCITSNQKYVCAGVSIEHELYPTKNGQCILSGNVRMKIKPSGFVIERNIENPKESVLTQIHCIDYGGSIPASFLKSTTKENVSLCLDNIRKVLHLRDVKRKEIEGKTRD